MVVLRVHVTPRAGRDDVGGWRGDELAVRVSAVPEGGRANAAVCKVVAGALGVPKSSVSVLRGASGRHKTLGIAGMDEGEVARVFGGPDSALF